MDLRSMRPAFVGALMAVAAVAAGGCSKKQPPAPVPAAANPSTEAGERQGMQPDMSKATRDALQRQERMAERNEQHRAAMLQKAEQEARAREAAGK